MDVNTTYRQETPADHRAVEELILKAFSTAPHSDQTEHQLVSRLRKAPEFISELSIVALDGDKVVGHILFTPISVINDDQSYPSLALAPVSVLPSYQGEGIGSMLISTGHARAKELGHSSSILLGEPGYYSRLGYRPCEQWGITLPFDVPSEYCMAIELQPHALEGVTGVVRYPQAFIG